MLSIGQFSKICQVSIKTLHYYDKIGLLHPCSIDQWTGYRHYDESQIPTMLLIQRLKRYGFALSEIHFFLYEPDNARLLHMLNDRKTALSSSIDEISNVINEMNEHITTYERTGNIMSYQNAYTVSLETTTDMPILSLRQKMSVEDFGKAYGHLFEKIARAKITTNGNVMAFYHDEEFDPACSDIEVAIGVTDKSSASRILNGCTCAVTTHIGAYSGLSDAYGAIVRWINENGYEVSDAPYEIYLKTQFDNLPTDKWETKIFFPVRKK